MAVNVSYTHGIDDLLRFTSTQVSAAGQSVMAEELVFNSVDQIEKKKIGGDLQIVDYTYDDIGRLLTINDLTQTACIEEVEICQFYWGNVDSGFDLEDQNCGQFRAIKLNDTIYSSSDLIDLNDTDSIQQFIQTTLNEKHFRGDVEIFYQDYFGVEQDFHISLVVW